MTTISFPELNTLLTSRGRVVATMPLDLSNHLFKDLDLSGMDLSDIDFSQCNFVNVRFDNANLSRSNLSHVMCSADCSFKGAILKDADISASIFRHCDFSNSNMEGANLFRSVFEFANMDNIKIDDNTKYFKMRCPEKGAFVGYKRCFNDAVVMLLIPADAKRSSATHNSCRCDKAKVLQIQSFDGKVNLKEAWSVVDENFVYRVGEYVSVPDFNEDRWRDSTTGIHFWMTREEAYSYLK
ncbi:MAG: pentapeptide repeat-containing protein [Lachnospiraceae bacterium]|jgi:uncharacterized protein YjbI with pentapeptide repeats|nr:pentapeptide repeat-containing protein [Lachnospiraceae bacterium]